MAVVQAVAVAVVVAVVVAVAVALVLAQWKMFQLLVGDLVAAEAVEGPVYIALLAEVHWYSRRVVEAFAVEGSPVAEDHQAGKIYVVGGIRTP